ncbi:MAG: hypothetical protein J3R72DRAFT_442784 [Linnemannia gamsii]|nr:MAG: hypothetical protein J3R72DRAFT_442784 [Linnemannia gamsii]
MHTPPLSSSCSSFFLVIHPPLPPLPSSPLYPLLFLLLRVSVCDVLRVHQPSQTCPTRSFSTLSSTPSHSISVSVVDE